MDTTLLAFHTLFLSIGLHPSTGLGCAPRFNLVRPVVISAQKAKNDARATIETLVNHNPVPKLVGTEGEARPIFDVKYDWAEYHRVWKAVGELAPNVEALWTELVKHLDDDRYCLTAWTFSENTHNLTVGEVCRQLISDCLSQAYYQHLEPSSLAIYGRWYGPNIARDKKELKAWCVARIDKRLYELQVEKCRWAVKELEESRRLPDVSKAKQRAWIAAIKAEIESLKKSKRAVPSHWFGGEGYTPFSAKEADHFRKQAMESDEKRGEKRTSGSGKK